MKNSIYRIVLSIILFIGYTVNVHAQCAMCAAQMESNASSGSGINTGINSGILYLMIFPYILIAIVAYLYYRSYKKNKQKVAGL